LVFIFLSFIIIALQFSSSVFYWSAIREPTPKNLVGSL